MWKMNEPDKKNDVGMNDDAAYRKQPGNVVENSTDNEPALIGRTIIVKGELIGQEDVMIQGRVEGKVLLEKNTLHVGRNGIVQANVIARIVQVDGRIIGDVTGKERVMVSKAGSVEGNITAPRVVLEDGSRFKGSIDMKGRTDEATVGGNGGTPPPVAAAPLAAKGQNASAGDNGKK